MKYSIEEKDRNINRRKIEYVIDKNGCHICISHSISGNYAQVKRNGKTLRVHRYVYELNHGKVSNDIVIRHKCDNTLCINVEHLEVGTHQDNMRDMVERGRSARGTKNRSAKLNEDQIREIFLLIEEGKKTMKEIAMLYGVHRNTIFSLKSGTTYKNVETMA